MKTFEYSRNTFDEPISQERLDRYGAEGWELVSETTYYTEMHHELKWEYIFKREIPTP